MSRMHNLTDMRAKPGQPNMQIQLTIQRLVFLEFAPYFLRHQKKYETSYFFQNVPFLQLKVP